MQVSCRMTTLFFHHINRTSRPDHLSGCPCGQHNRPQIGWRLWPQICGAPLASSQGSTNMHVEGPPNNQPLPSLTEIRLIMTYCTQPPTQLPCWLVWDAHAVAPLSTLQPKVNRGREGYALTVLHSRSVQSPKVLLPTHEDARFRVRPTGAERDPIESGRSLTTLSTFDLQACCTCSNPPLAPGT